MSGGRILQILPYAECVLRRRSMRGSAGPWDSGLGASGESAGARSSICSASGMLFRIRGTTAGIRSPPSTPELISVERPTRR